MIGTTRRSRLVLLVTISGIFGSFSAAARGDDPKADSVDAQTKIFLDTSAKREAREQALELALGLARNRQKPGHAADLKPALITLLSDQLKSKAKDPTYLRFLALAFKGMDVYDAPDPDISRLAHPYLAPDVPEVVKCQAVQALQKFGSSGHFKELLAIVEDYSKAAAPPPAPTGGGDNPAVGPLGPGGGGKHKGPLLGLVTEVAECDLSPTSEALPLLAGIVKQTHFPGARREACRALGDFILKRPAKEVHADDMAKALLDVCGMNERDQNLACSAAGVLWRFGNPEGFNRLVLRFDDNRKATKEVYTAFCAAVHAPKGFNNVPPARFTEFDPTTRGLAIAQLRQAWLKASTRSPDDTLLDSLVAAGISVPANRGIDNKDVIAALIEGLDLDARDLRYGCLDLLAHRTPRKNEVRLFKTLREVSGPANATLTVTQEEPPGGFQSPVLTQKLRAEQTERVKQWRSWWRTFSVTATLVDGVWTAPDKK